jgi:hypothetical protein
MSNRSFRKHIPAAWRRRIFALAGLAAALAGIGFGTSSASGSAQGQQGAPAAKSRGGYVLERDAEIAREEPGTHKGGGQTIGYSFFKEVPNLALVFRKRTFKPGSAIGYHEQKLARSQAGRVRRPRHHDQLPPAPRSVSGVMAA